MNIKPVVNTIISEDNTNEKYRKLEKYIFRMRDIVESLNYSSLESSIILPSDETILESAEEVIKQINSRNITYLIVVGIGGSNLGTQAIYEAIGSFNSTQIIFLDTTSEDAMHKCISFLEKNIQNKDEVFINIISKSGLTTETIANFEVIYSHLSLRFGNISDRVVVTTDEGSTLEKHAKDNDFYILHIPKFVGGRYSIFTTVGLFPLLLIGLDVKMLLDGARSARYNALNEIDGKNYAARLATQSYALYELGVTSHNMFLFEPRFESLGKWWRQLVGESLGKQFDVDGEKVKVGIIPIVSVGSTDLHSVGQLYLSSSREIFTTFVSFNEKRNISIPDNAVTDIGKSMSGKTLNEVSSAIYGGVIIAYKNKSLPMTEIIFDELNEFELGYFLQLKMMEIMYTAHLFNINAFDQPNVEDYKKETRKLLI